MAALFADTFYFIALLDSSDARHPQAVAWARQKGVSFVTTEYVLVELGDAFHAPGQREEFAVFNDAVRADAKFRVLPASPGAVCGRAEPVSATPGQALATYRLHQLRGDEGTPSAGGVDGRRAFRAGGVHGFVAVTCSRRRCHGEGGCVLDGGVSFSSSRSGMARFQRQRIEDQEFIPKKFVGAELRETSGKTRILEAGCGWSESFSRGTAQVGKGVAIRLAARNA